MSSATGARCGELWPARPRAETRREKVLLGCRFRRRGVERGAPAVAGRRNEPEESPSWRSLSSTGHRAHGAASLAGLDRRTSAARKRAGRKSFLALPLSPTSLARDPWRSACGGGGGGRRAQSERGWMAKRSGAAEKGKEKVSLWRPILAWGGRREGSPMAMVPAVGASWFGVVSRNELFYPRRRN